jgi:hypothetical protein
MKGALKKCLVALLLAALASAAAGCGKGGGSKNFKVGIVTGTVAQGEDEYRAAEKMKARYGDRIVHVTYPDNFMQEQETTISRIVGLASDPEIKAILVSQAVPGTAAAIDRIRRTRKDVLMLAAVSHEDPKIMAEKADLVLDKDELQRGKTIIALAKKMGAKKFLHYSFPRHMSLELVARRRDIMQEECAAQGIEFIQVSAPDPMGPDGIPGTQRFILEDVPRQVAAHGKDICVFGTNVAMMEAMIRAALASGAIFAEQCSPGPTMGYPGALGISVKGMAGDMKAILEAVEDEIVKRGGSGRFATWPVAISMTFIQAATELAFGAVEGRVNLGDTVAVEAALEKEAGTDVQVRRYADRGNFYLVVASSHIFGGK